MKPQQKGRNDYTWGCKSERLPNLKTCFSNEPHVNDMPMLHCACSCLRHFQQTCANMWERTFCVEVPEAFNLLLSATSDSRHYPVTMASNSWTMPDNIDEDDALLVAKEIHDRNLSPEERALFDAAKEDALKPWILNHAWEPADNSTVQPGEAVPARLLLKWKRKDGERKANARVILQGFKHVDVVSRKLDTESPTLSKVGRQLIILLCSHLGWRLWGADVKAAFLQADTLDKDIRLFAVPNRDMRKRLARSWTSRTTRPHPQACFR